MNEAKKGRIKQSGTPQSPALVIVDVGVVEIGRTPGVDRFHSLQKGESRSVWYALEGRRPAAVAESPEALAALLVVPVREPLPSALDTPPRAGSTSRVRARLIAVSSERKFVHVQARPFHNPYNFVPFAPRPDALEIGRRLAPPDDPTLPADAGALADGPPPGHHAFLPDRWQGHLDVVLTLATPLLLPEAEAAREPVRGHPDHKVFPVIERNGRPYLPGTSLKGALRSAYEALTNSRLPRFDRHDGRMGYRRPASSALGLVGARVVKCSAGILEMQTYNVAALSTYLVKTPPVTYASGARPRHGDEVWVEVARKGKNNVAYVTGIAPKISPCPSGWVEGFAYVTGQNISRKRCERVFYNAQKVMVERGADADRLRQAWRDLMDDYRDTHTPAEIWGRRDRAGAPVAPTQYLDHEPGKTAWSAHIWDDRWKELTPGSLCYLSIGSNGTRIDALYPVLISRKLAEVSPRDLVPASHLPATCWAEFSPADRVFGWVSEDRASERGTSREQVSLPYRGHVRLGPITCTQTSSEAICRLDTHDKDGLPLAILSAPKPRQARFYVGRADGMAQDDGLTPEQAGYAGGKILRGRKFYPHHNGAPAQHWEKPNEPGVGLGKSNEEGHRWFREFRRPLDDIKEQRDDQNRSVLGWVKAGVRFEFRVYVVNLAEVELGALLTLLQTDPGWHLRLGGGKPLGFGSATLQVVGGEISTGQTFGARYRSLTPAPTPTSRLPETVQRLRSRFQAAAALVWGEAPPHLLAVEQAGQGFPDRLPVHYPRASRSGGTTSASPVPASKGESFKWFVANDGMEGTKARHGYALDDLAGRSRPTRASGG